jgi:hypothetical protein
LTVVPVSGITTVTPDTAGYGNVARRLPVTFGDLAVKVTAMPAGTPGGLSEVMGGYL